MARVSSDIKKVEEIKKGTQFIQLTNELISSDAWRSMSINARRMIDRIILEHMNHAGTENGNLIVTYADFKKVGINGNYVKRSILELEKLNLIEVEFVGRKCYNESYPNRFKLTFFREKTISNNNLKLYVSPSHKWKLYKKIR